MPADTSGTTSRRASEEADAEATTVVTVGGTIPRDARQYAPADWARLRERERLILRARVAALERTVDRKDQQLQTVIEQYERILSKRAGRRPERDGDPVEIDLEDGDSEKGLFDRLRSLF